MCYFKYNQVNLVDDKVRVKLAPSPPYTPSRVPDPWHAAVTQLHSLTTVDAAAWGAGACSGCFRRWSAAPPCGTTHPSPPSTPFIRISCPLTPTPPLNWRPHIAPPMSRCVLLPAFHPASVLGSAQRASRAKPTNGRRMQDMLNDVVASSFNNSFVTLRTVRSWLFDTPAGKAWVEERTALMHKQMDWVRAL